MKQEEQLLPITYFADVNPPVLRDGINDDGEVSFIPMSDVSETGRWSIRQSRFLCEVRKGFTPFQEGDVLFAKITPCMENGKGCHAIGLRNGIGYGTTEFHVLRAKSGNDARFIFHITQSKELRLRAETKMTGSAGQQRVPASFFSEYKIPSFVFDEQKSITDVLDSMDRAIELTEALIAKQQRIKAGLMHDLLTKGIDEHGDIRSEATHEFKDSPLGRIPAEWDTPQIETMLSRIIDYRGKTPKKSDHGIPLITAKIIKLGYLLEPDEFVDPETYAKWMTRGFPETGDVLFTTEAPLGNVAQVKDPKIALGQRVLTLQTAPDLKNDFLFFALLHPRIRAQFDRASSGSTVTGVKQSQFRLIRILLPKTEEQQRIVKVLKAIDKNVQLEAANLSKLKTLKTGLMQDLLTGKIRVTSLLETPLRTDG